MAPSSPPTTLTVVGSYISPYVRKVLAVLEHKRLPYAVDPIVPFYGNAEFERLSPARRIPVLLDGGTAVADSSVIVEYLEEKWPSPAVLPDGAGHRARARWLAEYAGSVLGEVFIWRYFNQLVINRFVWGKAPDQAIVDKAHGEDIPGVLDYLETQLPAQGWLFGDTLSVADIALCAFFRNLAFARYTVDAGRWSHTAAFVQRTLAQPCFTALARFEDLCMRTPLPQHRAALEAAGAPLSAQSWSADQPRKGLLSR